MDPLIASALAEAAAHRTTSQAAAPEPHWELVGVGVGPGDPELLTLKAARELREADLVFAPTTALDKPSRAAQIVHEALGIEAKPLVFALDDTGGLTEARTAAWDEAGRAVVDAFHGGARRVAFATLGDPNLYSTFTYLGHTVAAAEPGIRIRTVPGITAMQDLAARAGVPLAEGREPLTLVPVAGAEVDRALDAMEAALAGTGTVVIYKGGRHLDALVSAVERAGRTEQAVLGTDLGLPGETISRLADRVAAAETSPARAPYFTTLIAPPARGQRGGAL
ncbi:MAG TPA: precorrin-2 C(20)-methyltransferase [Actinocrinis sp.]|nr:precorrin-2 C(20)-methyltransferase [Actinocrinis sp.]HZU59081.1 precorrin-2 C(20)-methyltransferase [Actinocrinis sp.]